MNRSLPLALLSGIPALVYQVIWTRELALVVGSQIEGISVVLAAFFGGLALGAWWLGVRADHVASPLRFYAALEAGAGLLAFASLLGLRLLAREGEALAPALLLALGAGAIVPVTFLLGGTLPALLRAAAPARGERSRSAGVLVAANTTGAVAGVVAAAFGAPYLGLAATFGIACLGSLALGLAAAALARGEARVPPSAPSQPAQAPRIPAALLVAAALAGALTLGFEALGARAASLRLGSSLFAWAFTLGVVLVGLAAGNAIFAGAASRSRAPARALGWIEAGAAAAVALSFVGLHSSPTVAATGINQQSLYEVGMALLLPALMMGGAFPFFVRLAVGADTGADPDAHLGSAFGTLSGANTAGGIAGALLAPLWLLPSLGLAGALLACVSGSALLAAAFLLSARGTLYPLAAAVALAAPLAIAVPLSSTLPPGAESVLFVHHGRQASAAVVRFPVRGGRDLYVDGDPEASTQGLARETEMLLAAIPLTLHPAPKSFLEVGFGSGITLGTAIRFPLEEIHCVEISEAVLRAAPFFEPDNAGVAAGADPRVRIEQGDGRAFLARTEGRYDVVVANTVQPWSVGATGLYSREYFERVADALREGGIAAQWLPVDRIGAEDLGAVLRTFFDVFPSGAVYWGGGNILVVGSRQRLPAWQPDAEASERLRQLGLPHYLPLDALKVGAAATVRFVVGDGTILTDDVPRLEARSARARSAEAAVDPEEEEILLLEQIASAGRSARTEALRLWLESLTWRRRGDAARADRFETQAMALGLFQAHRARATRLGREGLAELTTGSQDEAERLFQEALEVWAGAPQALLGSAHLAQLRNDPNAAAQALQRLISYHPRHAEAWNQLADLLNRSGQPGKAQEALDHALEVDPFFPQALANRGLLALDVGDEPTARRMLVRLEAISPYGERPETQALRAAIDAL